MSDKSYLARPATTCPRWAWAPTAWPRISRAPAGPDADQRDRPAAARRGLGAQLGPIYQRGVAQGAKGPLGNVVNLLVGALNVSGNNLGVAKNYFANGAANNPSVTPRNYAAAPAVAPAGYSLPTYDGLPNTRDSVYDDYDLAYGVTTGRPARRLRLLPAGPGGARPLQHHTIRRRSAASPPTRPSRAGTPPTRIPTASCCDAGAAAVSEHAGPRGRLRQQPHRARRALPARCHREPGARDLRPRPAFTNPAYIDNAAVTGTAINLPAQFLAAQASSSLPRRPVRQHRRRLRRQRRECGRNPYVPSAANQAAYQAA